MQLIKHTIHSFGDTSLIFIIMVCLFLFQSTVHVSLRV